MKCTRVEKFLPLHVAGDLAERRARAVENHLAACENCRLTADEYRASRAMFSAATLSPDFEGAFYDEIRESVLARIKRDRTAAPSSGFSRFFNARLVAAAASLSLLLIAAALALHSYTRGTSTDGERERMTATVEREHAAAPATINSPQVNAQEDHGRVTAPARDGSAPGTASRKQRVNGLSSPSNANIRNARKASRPGLNMTPHTPPSAGRNPAALTVAATKRANAGEIDAGGGSGETNAQAEVSRIEIQTSDPDIRIIWLSPAAEETVQPLK